MTHTVLKPLTKLKHGRKRAYATAAVEAVDRAKKEAIKEVSK